MTQINQNLAQNNLNKEKLEYLKRKKEQRRSLKVLQELKALDTLEKMRQHRCKAEYGMTQLQLHNDKVRREVQQQLSDKEQFNAQTFLNNFDMNRQRYFSQLNSKLTKIDRITTFANSTQCEFPIHSINDKIKEATHNQLVMEEIIKREKKLLHEFENTKLKKEKDILRHRKLALQ